MDDLLLIWIAAQLLKLIGACGLVLLLFAGVNAYREADD